MNNNVIGTIAAAMLTIVQPVFADSYPDHPVKIIHGFGPGGNADTVARLIAEPLSKQFGQPFVVEPKPGAGGQLASAFVSNSDPDGYTLQLLVGGHSVTGALYKNLNFEPVDGFTFINRISYFPFFVAVRHGTYDNIEDLIAAAKDGGRVKFGSAGAGTTQHLTGELLASDTGANFLHIPYKGGTGAVAALLGGEVDLVVATGTSVLSQAKAGELDLLAVTWDTPWPGETEVPTLGSTVAPGFNVFSWLGLGGPAGIDDDITNALSEAVGEIVMTEDVTGRLNALGGTPAPMKPEAFHDMVAEQIATWNEVIDEIGLERR